MWEGGHAPDQHCFPDRAASTYQSRAVMLKGWEPGNPIRGNPRVRRSEEKREEMTQSVDLLINGVFIRSHFIF